MREVYKTVEQMTGKKGKPQKNLSTDANGKMLEDAEATAAAWEAFLRKKFAATGRELNQRPKMSPLPEADKENIMTREEIKKGISKMKNRKACGLDGIPSEVYKYVPECEELLVELIQRIWRDEEVPEQLAKAVFVMLYKNKGSANDPTKYRCIGLLCHSYKVLSQCMLMRLNTETDGYLSDWQAGFRQNRGCRDNSMILRTIIEDVLEQGQSICATFIDYSAAFDSVSHNFIDSALADAGASIKTRRLFRAIYQAASAVTKVQGVDGKVVYSTPFPIRRGVVQGDITSPLYFIIALEAILRKHDRHQHKGVSFGGTTVATLGYADDAALLDKDPKVASERVTAISHGSEVDADMKISIPKTKCMHIMSQGKAPTVTNAEAKAQAKIKCPHIGCNKVFNNVHGMKVHAGKCEGKNYYLVDRILDVRGDTGSATRKFLISWQGYDDTTWEPWSHLNPKLIKEFLLANGKYDHAWGGVRCKLCDKPCKNERDLKCHARHCFHNNHYHLEQEQDFKGRKAESAAKFVKIAEDQQNRPEVLCENKAIENVYKFKYLGTIVAADGNTQHDITRRVAMAMRRCGQLRNIFDSPNVCMGTKLSIYKTAVVSLLTYGCEAWSMSNRTKARINGANSRMLSRFTGKSAHEESSKRSQTFDLVSAIRKRKLQWLGHLLRLKKDRMGRERLVKLAIRVQFKKGMMTNMLSDAPITKTFEELEALAADRRGWKRIRDGGTVRTTTMRELADSIKITNKPPLPPQHPITKKESKYVKRDEHEAFFRPNAPGSNKHRKLTRKPKPKKPRPLTNKERAAWARKHYADVYEQQAASGPINDAADRTTINSTKIKNHMIMSTSTAMRAVFSSSESDLSIPSDNDESDYTDFIPRRGCKLLTRSSASKTPTISNTINQKSKPPNTDNTETPPPSPTTTARISTSREHQPSISNSLTPTISKDKATPPKAMKRYSYRTRSSTVQSRQRALNAAEKSRNARQNSSAKTTAPPPSKAKKRSVPSTRPKRVRMAPSQIPGAGMGLYLLESVKAGERQDRKV